MGKKTETGAEYYKKVFRRRRIFVVSVALILLILCICLFTPLFGITEITVVGNSHLSAEEIIVTSGIKAGDNVFRARCSKGEKALEELAYVEECTIKRKFPARLVIEIVESKQDLIFDTPTEFVVTTMEGRVLEKTDDVTNLSAPIVRGVNVTKSDVALGIETDDKDAYDMHMERIYCFYESSCWAEIDEFYVSDVSNFILTTKAGMKVTFGSIDSIEGLKRKIKMLEKILPQVEQTQNSYLDLTDDRGYYGEYTPEELEEMREREENGETILSEREKKKNKEDAGGSDSSGDDDEDDDDSSSGNNRKASPTPSADGGKKKTTSAPSDEEREERSSASPSSSSKPRVSAPDASVD